MKTKYMHIDTILYVQNEGIYVCIKDKQLNGRIQIDDSALSRMLYFSVSIDSYILY